ncbi:LysR family transcriptional regulator [Gottfriedia sp. NPDC057991]|uniref:helix-turn-helix domain-containing protein n=1 Tax=Gottfriedia sp. NPDC057991 TaxID=3346298 RepID=UPI0036DCE979
MNIKQLNYLIDVVTSESFLSVAQKYHVSESVIIQSIFKLENEMGCKLIECLSDSKVILTFEGSKIISFVKEVVLEYEELGEIIEEIKK